MRAYAVIEGTETITEIELPTPTPQGNEVLLKVTKAGVCHTDVHLREGYYDMGSQGKLMLSARGLPYPMVMGHEVVATVEAIGADVGGLAPGDVRLVYPWLGEGTCTACQSGHENLCAAGAALGIARHGGYAEYILVPHERYLIDIGDLEPGWAATLACSGLTAYSAALKALPAAPEAPVAVIGAGGVGAMAVAALVALGHKQICVVDVNPANLELATSLGATSAVRADGAAVADGVRGAVGGPCDAVVDFVNNSVTAPLALDLLTKGGTMVQVGMFGGELTIPTPALVLKAVSIRGSYVGSLQELLEVVDLAKAGVLPRIPIRERPLGVVEINESLDQLVTGGMSGRIVLNG